MTTTYKIAVNDAMIIMITKNNYNMQGLVWLRGFQICFNYLTVKTNKYLINIYKLFYTINYPATENKFRTPKFFPSSCPNLFQF